MNITRTSVALAVLATATAFAGAAHAAAAAAVEAGTIKPTVQRDRTTDRAARADTEHRSQVTAVTAGYPVSAEPQRHFTAAVAAVARKDYHAAAIDIRKATGYVRLETERASGGARRELARSVAALDRLAAAVEKGTVNDEQALARTFTMANHALALEHRARAADAWAHKEYATVGYELRAAAQELESAAGWVGGAARSGAAASVADVRTLSDALVSGGTWTRDEVARGFESLGNGLNALGRKISGSSKAAPVHVVGA